MKKTIALAIVTLALAAELAFAMGETPQEKFVTIGGKEFLIPADSGALYDENSKAIRFILYAETLEIKRKGDPFPDMRKKVEVFVVEDGNEAYGEQKFWPHALERNDYFNCNHYELKNKKYEFCQYNQGQEAIHIWGDNVYVLRERKKNNPVLLLGCDNPEVTKLPNPLCEGKGLMLSNIHIRSLYSVENFNAAFKIDQAIRQIVTNFHNLAKERENVVHAEPN